MTPRTTPCCVPGCTSVHAGNGYRSPTGVQTNWCDHHVPAWWRLRQQPPKEQPGATAKAKTKTTAPRDQSRGLFD